MNLNEMIALSGDLKDIKKDIIAALLTIAWGAANDSYRRTAAEVRGIYKNMKENLE